MNALDELKRMDEQVRSATGKLANLEGQLKVLRDRLATEHGCRTLEAAEAKIKKQDAQLRKLEAELEAGVTELREDPAWT